MKESIKNFLLNKNLELNIHRKNDFRNFKIYNVPYYKEEFNYIGSLIIIQGILFSTVKIPVRAFYMIINFIFINLRKEEIKLMSFYVLKFISILIGVYSYENLRHSDMFKYYIDESIRSIKGGKLFSFMKIFEVSF